MCDVFEKEEEEREREGKGKVVVCLFYPERRFLATIYICVRVLFICVCIVSCNGGKRGL